MIQRGIQFEQLIHCLNCKGTDRCVNDSVSDFVFKGSEVCYGEVLGGKGTMYTRVTLY